jgi:hypothetical protein
MRPSADQPNDSADQASLYIAVFASAAVFNVLFHVIPKILSFVGAPEPERRALAIAVGVGGGAAGVLIPMTRGIIAWLITLAGPVILGVWFSLKKTSDPNPVTVLMAAALVPLSLIVFSGLRLLTAWKAAIAIVLGALAGKGLGHWLRDTVGPEATWLLAAAIISAASLAQKPVGQARVRWVLGFLTAAVAVMLVAVQIKLEPMRLEWHLPVPRTLEDHSTDTR